MNIIANRARLTDGTVLNGRYRITGFLGEGGFSITYRAMHMDIQKEVAIKEFFCRDYMSRDSAVSNSIADHDADNERLNHDLQHFLQEAKVLSSLSDVDGIVHVTDYFRENGTAYMVMDLVSGISLEDFLRDTGTLTWNEVLNMFLPLMKSLDRVHKKGLIHRDIKPDNLVVAEDGSLTLIDFGAALRYGGDETHSVYLSEGYAPKEQYLRSGKLGPFTDVYALCAVIYRCITGQVPEHSIQRTVFDELQNPSDLGVQLPAEFEEILMRGLQIEPKERWQDMNALYQAFSSLLPRPKKNRKALYVAAGILIAFLVVGIGYVSSHYSELKMRRLKSQGEVVTFRLEAPDDMTASELDKTIRVVRERAETFSGKNNYLMQTDSTGITMTIPRQYFEDQPWDMESMLYSCFAFEGVWTLPRHAEMDLVEYFDTTEIKEYLKLSPDGIQSVELNYGPAPATVVDALDLLSTDAWKTEDEAYYLKIVFDQEAADFLDEMLSEEGVPFTVYVATENEGSLLMDQWISAGDGETAYYPIGGSESEHLAETMQLILSSESFSEGLELIWSDEDNEELIEWQEPDTENSLQCSPDDFDVPTVELSAEVYGKDASGVIAFCKQQMQILDIPYALGQDQTTIHIRIPADKVNSLVLCSLFGADINIGSGWSTFLYDPTILKADAGGSGSITIQLDESDMESLEEQDELTEEDLYDSAGEDQSDSSDNNPVYLYLGEIRIGIMDSMDTNSGTMTFSLLLPEDGDDTVISGEVMTEYLCNLLLYDAPDSTLQVELWRDSSGNIMSKKNIPTLRSGLDISRFSNLFSAIEELGGNAEFMIDDILCDEEIHISFDNWAGSFPDETLEMIKTIYEDEGLSDNLCPLIDFEINTWYHGDPVQLSVYFAAEGASRSVICTGGSIWVDQRDRAVLEQAKDVIENSDFFYPSEDRFYDADDSNIDEYVSYSTVDWYYSTEIRK